jgi:hypothetical protein
MNEPTGDRVPGSAQGVDRKTVVEGKPEATDPEVRLPPEWAAKGSSEPTDYAEEIEPERFYLFRGDRLRRILWEAGGAVSRVFMEIDRDLVMPSEEVNEALREYIAATPEIAEHKLDPAAAVLKALRSDLNLNCRLCDRRIGHSHDDDCDFKVIDRGIVLMSQTNYQGDELEERRYPSPRVARRDNSYSYGGTPPPAWSDTGDDSLVVAAIGGVVLLAGLAAGVIKRVRA